MKKNSVIDIVNSWFAITVDYQCASLVCLLNVWDLLLHYTVLLYQSVVNEFSNVFGVTLEV